MGDEEIGRMVIGLFGDVVPKTVLNFKTLAEGTVVRGSTYCLNGCMEIVNRFPHLMWRIIRFPQYHSIICIMYICQCVHVDIVHCRYVMERD